MQSGWIPLGTMVAGNQFHNRFKCLVIFRFPVAGSLPLLATASATLGSTGNNQFSDQPGYAAASGSTSAPCVSQQSCPVARSRSTASLTVTRDRPTTSGALRSNTAALPSKDKGISNGAGGDAAQHRPLRQAPVDQGLSRRR